MRGKVPYPHINMDRWNFVAFSPAEGSGSELKTRREKDDGCSGVRQVYGSVGSGTGDTT